MADPISIRSAARLLGISKDRAARIVLRHHLRTRPSPVNPRAKMLDAAAVAELRRLAKDQEPVTA